MYKNMAVVILNNASHLQEYRITKTTAQTFAPEMSHFFEVLLPFDPQVGCAALANELLRASLVVEVWHQVPPPKEGVVSGCSTNIIGRRLHYQDVLLGIAHVPLKQLLTHTGM